MDLIQCVCIHVCACEYECMGNTTKCWKAWKSNTLKSDHVQNATSQKWSANTSIFNCFAPLHPLDRLCTQDRHTAALWGMGSTGTQQQRTRSGMNQIQTTALFGAVWHQIPLLGPSKFCWGRRFPLIAVALRLFSGGHPIQHCHEMSVFHSEKPVYATDTYASNLIFLLFRLHFSWNTQCSFIVK